MFNLKAQKENRQVNPLEIHLVAEKILGNLGSLQDLLTCRKVCRLWNDVASKTILRRGQKVPINFVPEWPKIIHRFLGSDFEKNWHKTSHPTLSVLPEFMEYLEHGNGHLQELFKDFHFENLQMDGEIVDKFFSEFGSKCKKLTLHLENRMRFLIENGRLTGKVEDSNLQPHIDYLTFRNLFYKCPNLEELVLHFLPRHLTQKGFIVVKDKFPNIKKLTLPDSMLFSIWGDNCSPFLRDLFRCCPSLEEFNCVLPPKVMPKFGHFSTAAVLDQLLESKCVLTISSLTLENQDASEGTLQLLATDGKMLLKYLRLVNLVVVDAHSAFHVFMQQQSKTLEAFRVDKWWGKEREVTPRISFPRCMEKLKTLEITIAENEHFICFSNIDFASQFPICELLRLQGNLENCNAFPAFFSSGEEHKILKTFLHPPNISADFLNIAKYTFPNAFGNPFPTEVEVIKKAQMVENNLSKKRKSLRSKLGGNLISILEQLI